jgi:hypothetical protein
MSISQICKMNQTLLAYTIRNIEISSGQTARQVHHSVSTTRHRLHSHRPQRRKTGKAVVVVLRLAGYGFRARTRRRALRTVEMNEPTRPDCVRFNPARATSHVYVVYTDRVTAILDLHVQCRFDIFPAAIHQKRLSAEWCPARAEEPRQCGGRMRQELGLWLVH